MTVKRCVGFERLAFESALREHPGERTAQLAFTDYLMEHGYTLMGAKRLTAIVIREEVEKRQLAEVLRKMSTEPRAEETIRRIVVHYCRQRFRTDPRIRVVGGSMRPTWTRSTFRAADGNGEASGPPGWEPGGQARTRYAPVEETITVGAAWILSRLEGERNPLIA